jgi:hypothetical protein
MPLPLLLLHASMAGVLLLNISTHELIEGAARKQSHVLTKSGVEPLIEQCHLLLIRVRVVGPILQEVVKPLTVLVGSIGALLHVQKLMQLAHHGARGNVVPVKSLPELGPRDLVAVLESGSVVCPPGTGRHMKLLGHIQSLLILYVVQ